MSEMQSMAVGYLLKTWATEDAQRLLELLGKPFGDTITLPPGAGLWFIQPSGMLVEVSDGQKWVEFQ